MPTALSSTERIHAPAGSVLETARRAVSDLRHLLWFRSTTVRRPRAAVVAVGVLLGLSASVPLVAAYADGAGDWDGSSKALDALILLPTGLTAFLLIAVVSAVASGGGRELLPREQAVAYPISPTTDHLGALLMAPLNIAWLVQTWTLLGFAGYALGRDGLPGVLLVGLWILFATALAQVLAWGIESVRRTQHGIAIVRTGTVLMLLAGAALQLSGHVGDVLNRVPVRWLVTSMVDTTVPDWGRFAWSALLLLALAFGAVVLGAVPAHWAARRAPRDELRIESGQRLSRPTPASDLAMVLRIDRASVWRAVPMRRGLMVLAIGPGLVALAGGLTWENLTVLPGLVASGSALLYGVNIWCLDGRGGLWRESLPVSPSLIFLSRAWVLAEWLLAGALGTMLLASLRAGRPTLTQVVALLLAVAVVVLQVVAAAMRWSAKRPFAADLRSARATPAPPVMMVAYSARLAVSTTITGMVFNGLSRLEHWQPAVIVAGFCLAWSALRLERARTRWLDPHQRAVVVTTTAG